MPVLTCDRAWEDEDGRLAPGLGAPDDGREAAAPDDADDVDEEEAGRRCSELATADGGRLVLPGKMSSPSTPGLTCTACGVRPPALGGLVTIESPAPGAPVG